MNRFGVLYQDSYFMTNKICFHSYFSKVWIILKKLNERKGLVRKSNTKVAWGKLDNLN